MRYSTAPRLPSSTHQAIHPSTGPALHPVRTPDQSPDQTPGERRRPRRPLLTAFIAIGLAAQLIGCAQSRHEQLKSMSGRVEKSLRAEQTRVVAMTNDPSRGARLDHLSQLKFTLSAANIGLAGVPYVVEEPQRPMAYDVLEEVYSAIDWNIPLGPTDPKKPLPTQFSNNTLNLNRTPNPSPAPTTPQRR